MAWLRLVRWKNLLIIFLTQFFAWRCVIVPHISAFNHGLPIRDIINFFCLSVSTLLIAAAGYIINDYFDIKIDTINRPEKVVLGKAIERKDAIILHTTLNIIALRLAGYVAAQAHADQWLLVQLCCTVLLWFYSTHFKRQYVTGNVVVALLTALTIVILIIYNPILKTGTRISMSVLLVYACFAFVLTWMREIVKDMEDFKGDEAEGCMTMPIKRGLEYSIGFTRVLSALVVLPLMAACYLLFMHQMRIMAAYVLVLLVFPVTGWAFYLGSKFTSPHYHDASKKLKIIMVLGICSLIVYYIQLFLLHAT